MSSVAHLVVGPDRHGVVTTALRIRDALERGGFRTPLVRSTSPADIPVLPPVDAVHLHVTDRLFAPTAAEAAAVVESIAAAVHRIGAAFVVTLHDLPQPSDGASAPVRIECYRRVVACADAVIVSSAHERALLAEAGIESAVPPVVIPLPMRARAASTPGDIADRTVGVLGFLYPGKGHLEVLDVLPAGVRFLALGAPSPGHDHLLDELGAAAAARGTEARVTGYIDDADLHHVLGQVTVPIAHHRHMSASGSIVTWIDHGRRPLVVAGRYTRELDARSPGIVTLYDEHDLAGAVARALDDPSSTWLADDVAACPTDSDVAAAHADLYTSLPVPSS